MHRPIFVFILLILLTQPNVASADKIILKTGREITGHIIQEDQQTGTVTLDIVDDNIRTGIKQIFFAYEIKEVVHDGQYAEAPYKTYTICYEYGYHWARCAMSAYFGYTCVPDEKFIIPSPCSDTDEVRRGIREGVASVYHDYPEIKIPSESSSVKPN